MLNRTPYAASRRARTGDRASHDTHGAHHQDGGHGIALALVAALAAVAGAFVAAMVLFPAAQVWPATVMSLLLAAAATALIAWIAPPEAGSARIVFWDIAGVLTVVGLLGAALVGEPEPAVVLLERQR
jgi:VIT1/CCC1 family predicted Fe2+/Mn2+ transporter